MIIVYSRSYTGYLLSGAFGSRYATSSAWVICPITSRLDLSDVKSCLPKGNKDTSTLLTISTEHITKSLKRAFTMAKLEPLGDDGAPVVSSTSDLPAELGFIGPHETLDITKNKLMGVGLLPDAKIHLNNTNIRLSAVTKTAGTDGHVERTPVPLNDSSDTLGSFVMCPSPIADVQPESQVVSTDDVGGTDPLDSVSRAP